MVTRVSNLEHLFPGKTEMAGRMRALDWSKTVLGPPFQWAEPLKHSVKLCLTSRFPIVMYWGAERIMLYNDPYIRFLGETKHPTYLGRTGREAWSDIWDTIDPLFQSVQRTGEASWSEDFLFFFARNLPREEVYVTYTIGPILLDSGQVEGFFCPCAEVTEKVIGARRLETLRKLGIQALETRTVDEACAAVANVLAENPFDIPFAAIYLVTDQGTRAVLKSLSGLSKKTNPLPSAVSVSDADPSPWPLATVLRRRRPSETPDLVAADMQVPGGPWPEPSSKAIVLPVFGAQHDTLSALAVLGVGPRRVLDDAYRTFFDLIAGHIRRAITDARAYEAEQQRAESLAEAEEALRQARDELEHRVNDRTRQLSAINTELIKEITERERAEIELTIVKDELAADLKTMSRLHELSTRLLATPEVQSLLEEVLDAAIELLNADFGNVQLCNPESRALEIVAQRGFKRDFLDYFASVTEESAACGRAAQRGDRVIIEDVRTDKAFAPHLHVAATAGFRAVQATPLFNRSGELLGMISTHFRQPHRSSDHDLRIMDLYAHLAAEFIERQRASEALRTSENRFRRYFDLGLIGMAITSPTKGILEVNDELCRILGYDQDELLQKTWVELTHPEDLAADIAQFNRVIAGEIDAYTLDKRWIRKDGHIVTTIMSAKCVRRKDGSVDYFVGLIQDITRRKLVDTRLRDYEKALHKAEAELAHVSRVTTLGELTASIAHEVNQPLGAIVTNGHACLRLLSRAKPDLASVREAIESMIADGVRASEVIKRIRAMLKKTSTGKSSYRLNEIIREVIAFTAAEREKHQISLKTHLAKDLPLVLVDRVQLQQVVLNLVLNSIEAMSEPDWEPRDLLIQTEQTAAKEVLITIRDTGNGIDPQHRDHVFEPFFTSKAGGLGLGLSISRTIIDAHGGKLWTVPSTPRQGTTFSFTLPVGPDS